MRAEFFMEDLDNGVKLCELIGLLQTKIAQSCPSALCKVSQTPVMKIARTIFSIFAFMLTLGVYVESSAGHRTVFNKLSGGVLLLSTTF